MSRVFALLPAAGHSRRMGQPKLALPVGERTVLDCVLQTLRSADVAEILVVLGPHVSQLATIGEANGAHVLVLPEETPDMRATVERGLVELERRFRPRDDDGWLLVPADHPTVSATIVRRLGESAQAYPEPSIFVPVAHGRRGHPALIRWAHVAGLRAWPKDEGINRYLRSHAAETREVPVEGEEAFWDLDTPEDYQRLLRWSGGGDR